MFNDGSQIRQEGKSGADINLPAGSAFAARSLLLGLEPLRPPYRAASSDLAKALPDEF
jgi:hypothetical protein